MTSSRAGVVAQHVSGTEWRAWGHDRSVVLSGPDRFEARALAQLGETIGTAFGGPEVRIVVLVIEGSPSGEAGIVAEYPRRVHAISPRHALACTLPTGWRKAAIVDLACGGGATFIFGDGEDGCDCEQELKCITVADVALVSRSLSVERCVIRCCDGASAAAWPYQAAFGPSATIVNDSPEPIIGGARRFAARQRLRRAGVWTDTPLSTELRANRAVSYSIRRTPRPIFDIDNDTLATVSGREVLLVVDGNVDRLYGPAIRRYAQHRLDLCGYVTTAACEAAKDWYEVESICRAAVEGKLGRSGTIVAVGGGVTLDVAGMAASVYRRGIAFIRVPTTLVGLVDVSVGIKQGINAFGYKNILGSFYPPIASLNDYSFLRSAPRWSIACGLAEILKLAAIRDESLFAALEQHGATLLESGFQEPALAADTVARRAEILMLEELAPNLFETNLQRLVDFGHTFSPVIETASNFSIPHGEAVALDMLLSTCIAVCKGVCNSLFRDRLADLLTTLGLPTWHASMHMNALKKAILGARAHRGGALNLVVPLRPGSATFIQDVSDCELTAALEWMSGNSRQWPLAHACEPEASEWTS